MLSIAKLILRPDSTAYIRLGHFIGRLTRQYYFEDFNRVYPDSEFDIFGKRTEYTDFHRGMFLGQQTFYKFAAQFVSGKTVCDIGCGIGYGAKVLKESGASRVFGADVSKKAISYAKSNFGQYAEFSIQTCTKLRLYADDSFDVAVCSEVLEHVKEYSKQDTALEELRRVTKYQGIILLGTPNSELLANHGFSFAELSSLLERYFQSFVIFENALVPADTDSRREWNERLEIGRTGVIVSEPIDFSGVTVWPPNM